MSTVIDIGKIVLRASLFIAGGLICFFLLYHIFRFLIKKLFKLPQKRWKELIVFISGSFIIFLILSLFSHIFSASGNNIVGQIGRNLAMWTFYLFGWQAYILIVIFVIWLWSFARSVWSKKKLTFNKSYTLTSVLISLSLFTAIMFGMFKIPGRKPVDGFTEFYASGWIGDKLADIGMQFLGKAGLMIAVLIFFILTIVITTGIDITFYMRKVFEKIKSFLALKYKGKKKRKKESKRKTEKIPDSSIKADTEVEEKELFEYEEITIDEIDEKYEQVKINYEDFLDKNLQNQLISLLNYSDEVSAKPLASSGKLAKALVNKLKDFKINGKVVNVETGPVITMLEYSPDPGVKVSKISSYSDDIAMAMHAEKVRIVAPIPGKSVVGIEVPNKVRQVVNLKTILEDDIFTESIDPLTITIGVDTSNHPIVDKLTKMPHLLIAGATGSGKSVCINSIICSIITRVSPKNVRFILMDPKRIELSIYNGIPHLIRPVIVTPEHAPSILKALINWMELRYKEFGKLGVRNIEAYNNKVSNDEKIPYIITIVDELADLMMTTGREVEESLTRLAQMSRAVGIHLILATQRPSVNVITGVIKANFPARIAFRTTSHIDSRTILDKKGAEKLLGKGDMLYLAPGSSEPARLHGAFISTDEATNIVKLWSKLHLEKLFTNKIKKPEKLAELIISNDCVLDSITDPEQTPGSTELLKEFCRTSSKIIGIVEDDIYNILTSFDYYPLLSEQEEAPLPEFSPEELSSGIVFDKSYDPLYDQAKDFVIRSNVASVSAIQRHFRVGYARAGRIIDQLERSGIIGPHQGSKSREVLVKRENK